MFLTTYAVDTMMPSGIRSGDLFAELRLVVVENDRQQWADLTPPVVPDLLGGEQWDNAGTSPRVGQQANNQQDPRRAVGASTVELEKLRVAVGSSSGAISEAAGFLVDAMFLAHKLGEFSKNSTPLLRDVSFRGVSGTVDLRPVRNNTAHLERAGLQFAFRNYLSSGKVKGDGEGSSSNMSLSEEFFGFEE